MNAVANFDDPSQTCFYIPFADENTGNKDTSLPQSIYPTRDLPDGEQLRIVAYKDAWKECLERVQSIIHALHAPVVAEIVHDILSSYHNPLLGLPHPELPVISISNSVSVSSFIDQVTAQTDSCDLEEGDLFGAMAFTAHIYPDDCTNLTAAMKAIIGGFIDRPHILGKVKGRPATSLAPYDVEALLAWYNTIRGTYGIKEKSLPLLVVLLHDFEQLNSIVVQDVFSILSLYVSRLPLVFLLALSSPSSSSYLLTSYPRSILSLLRVHSYAVPSGPKVLEEIILKTFFDVEFQPSIMIGPASLVYLIDFYNRHNSSLDTILSILQLIYLKHFSIEPLTLLVRSTPSPVLLQKPASSSFIDSLSARMQQNVKEASSSPSKDDSEWSQQSLSTLITTIDDTRASFNNRLKRLRIGFCIVEVAQKFMIEEGYKGITGRGESTMLDIAVDVLGGKLGSAVKLLGSMIRKLRPVQLKTLLGNLQIFFDSMPLEARSSEKDVQVQLLASSSVLPQFLDAEIDHSGITSQVATGLGEWLTEYLNDAFVPLEEATLWDIWYTGLTPFPIDLINPSLRASVVTGLLRPHDFAERPDDDTQTAIAMWELPDTSILFRGYLDSGRMVNLYDWFESFRLEIERQRDALKKEAAKLKSKSSPTKSGRRKGKERAERKKDEGVEEEGEEDQDQWKMEVQARFMRALQELDYLGFIKHTGRKADHVQRTVYDMHDG